MALTSLPAELIVAVLQCVDREGWKSLRLTNKAHHVYSTQLLFREIHLTPNTRSFDRARHIANTSNLAELVKSVVYHTGVLEEGHGGLDVFKSKLARFKKQDLNKTEEVLWLYNCFLEEIDGFRDFETRDENQELRHLLEKLPNIDSIKSILDECPDLFAPSDDYIGRRTGMQLGDSSDWRGLHGSSLFTAAVLKPLRTVILHSVSWFSLLRISTALKETRASFPHLKRFELGLDNGEFFSAAESSDDEEDLIEVFSDLLAVANNAEHLHLDFDELLYESDDRNLLLPISTTVFSQTWPSLTHLFLGGIVSTEDAIIEFLERHEKTLQHLHLDDIELTVDASSQPSDQILLPGSIISMFQRISKSPRIKLTTVTLTGNFCNRVDESYRVDLEPYDPASIVVQLEQWLCQKGPCPIPDIVLSRTRKNGPDIPYDSEDSDASDVPDSDGWYKAEVFEDESWAWDPDLLFKNY